MKNVKKLWSLILTVCMVLSVVTQTLMPVTAYAVSGNMISTVAGNGTGGADVVIGDNGPAVNAGVSPKGVAVDGSGNLYIADTGNNRIRRVDHSTGYISTVAGDGTRGFSGDDGPAVSAQLNSPFGVAVDGSGNLYIADTYNHRIRRVDSSTRKISTVAGTGIPGFSGDNIPAASAQLNRPLGVAVDGSGNLYIADADNNRIRRVDSSTGNISTVAGDGTKGFSGDDGLAASAQLNFPSGVVVDGKGSLYIADTYNSRIRRVDTSTGKISTVAGEGTDGFSGDNGPATSAWLYRPSGVTVDGSGNLYIADSLNNRIRMVDPLTGKISTVAGVGTDGFSGDNGPAASAQLNSPNGVAVDSSGSLYIAESNNARVRMVAPTSYAIASISDQTMIDIAAGYTSGTQETKTITVTRSGTGDLENLAAAFSGGAGSSFEITQPPAATLNNGTPSTAFTVKAKDGLAAGTYTETVTVSADSMTNVTFTVTQVVTVSPPIINTVAGNGNPGFRGDNGLATNAWLNYPAGVAVDGSGNLYIADAGNNCIRRVDHSTRNISTVAGTGIPGFSGDNIPAASAQLNCPYGVAVDGSGNLYVADTNNNRIRRVDPSTGNISTVAGNGSQGFSGDNGLAASARLDCPTGVAVDGSGNLYIADGNNHRIRRVDHSTGNISTVAGNGSQGFNGDNVPAANASLNNPRGVAVDGSGNLYIADGNNHRIRRVDHSTGKISTVVGDGTQGSSGGNGPATNARLNHPAGVAVDGSGNLYIADYSNSRILRVDPSTGNIRTVAGTDTPGFSGDGGPAASAKLIWPSGVAADDSGNLYIADTYNNRIRRISPASYTIASISDQTMTDITEGYTSGTQETKSIMVTRTGTGDLQNLAAAVSGGAGSSFEITQLPAAALNRGTPSTAFTVKAKDGLAAGTYTETVTVSADSMANVTFTVTQVVNASSPGAAPTIQSVVSGDAHVSITWIGVTGAAGYKIFNSTTPGSYSSVCNTVYGAVYSYDVTGLTNGVPYYFVVKASNGGGDSPGSAEVSAIPKTVPGAPTGVTAIAGNGQATINFTAPVDNGGSAITGYTVTSNPGNITAAGTGSLITLNGLTNGTAYTFTVTATNVAGTGAASAASSAVVPTAPSGIYTISFDANGGTGTAPTESNKAAGATFTAAAANSFTPPAGKQFKEWNTATNGSGTSYLAGATVTMPASNLTLYAIWEPVPAVTSITVAPPTVSVQKGNTQTFTATVNGTNSPGQTVTWSVYGNTSSSTSIDASGLLTVAADETAATLTVTATSAVDNTKSGTATVTVIAIPPAFVPVTSITGVPTATTVGVNLTLSGTVAPANATNQTVVWSVYSAGMTGATVSGNMLSTTAVGTVTVRATITDGLTQSSDYTQDFIIAVSTVPVTTCTVTFNSSDLVYTTKTVKAGESIGSAAWPTDPTRSSYTFGGWFTGENGAGTQFTSMTPVNATTTIYAKWTYSGGGGSSSGGGSTMPATSTYNAEVSAGNGSNVNLPVIVDKSSGKASVDIGTGNSLMSDGKTTVITVPAVPDIDTCTLGIPVHSLSTQDKQGALVFCTDTGTVAVTSNMLAGVSGISGSKAEISIGQGDKASLSSDVKTAIGDKPLISLSLSIDGKQTDWSNPNAPVTVSIPYTPTAAELANPESILIWYIDGSGNAVSIPNGHYDPASGSVTFTTTHFSYYAVGYNKVSFSDVAVSAWYNKAVGFMAARGITTGTGNGNYSPEAKLTRGEFLVMMMRAYGIAPDASPKDNFTDAGSTYYTGYLAAAKKLGITEGVGNNLFAPEKEITRQEMFTLLYNTLKSMDELPAGKAGKDLSAIEDANKIASWAKDAMTLFVKTGTVSGSEGMLRPADTSNRAQMAQVLYNLLSK